MSRPISAVTILPDIETVYEHYAGTMTPVATTCEQDAKAIL